MAKFGKPLMAKVANSYAGTDVVRVLRNMFPESRKFGLSHLNYYKRMGIIKPHGNGARRYDSYTFEDIVMLAWIIEMRTIGIPANSLFCALLKFRDAIAPDAEFHQKIGPLTWSYPIGELVTRVRARLTHESLQ